MSVSFENLIDVDKIGEAIDNPTGHLKESSHVLSTRKSQDDEEKTLLLAIDVQNDFMEKGALGVPGAKKDVENLLRFIYKNFEDITHIMASIDTHKPQQIFHSCWWENQDGIEPEPLTIITSQDIETGKWRPRYEVEKSIAYVKGLEESSKKNLCIWPYHCLKGTYGAALEGQFAELAYLHSIVRGYELKTVVKGEDPLSEMYGIIQPEYGDEGLIRVELIEELKQYQKIIIAGEAKSHCVLESVKQIIEHLKDEKDLVRNMYILTDCMSSIPGFEESTEAEFSALQEAYGIKLISSTAY